MTELKLLYNQDIFDVANKNGYTIDNVFKILTENPFITSINYDLNTNPGRVIVYDETFKVKSPQSLYQIVSVSDNPNRILISKDNQSLFDVALMTIGIENVMKLLYNNNISNINNTILEGILFNFSVLDIKDKGFYIQNFKITTGESKDTNIYYLLKEDGFYILQENDDLIIL